MARIAKGTVNKISSGTQIAKSIARFIIRGVSRKNGTFNRRENAPIGLAVSIIAAAGSNHIKDGN